MSRLYERTLYLNKDIEFLINADIVEYDLKSGGYNLCKYYKLLDDKKLARLESLNKKDRQIQLGVFMRKDKELSKKLTQAFKEARKLFFESNNIEDHEVLSIKKDAIFMLRRCDRCIFGNLEFVEKNIYTSYLYIDGKEMYYNKSTLDIKGISDDKLILHRDYMVDFLMKFINLLENNSIDYARKTLISFASYYKSRQLELGYYREMTTTSTYRLMNSYMLYGNRVGMTDVGEINEVDIGYNYIRIIKPLISIII